MEDKLPNCVAYLDGCQIKLFEAPIDNADTYFNRKQFYSINLQAICDNSFVIRQFSVGYPGSVHDSRVFNNSPIGENIAAYLNNKEWIAADSAYKLTSTVITPYRNNSRIRTGIERRCFNRYFSSNILQNIIFKLIS